MSAGQVNAGEGTTVKSSVLVSVPSGVVTEILAVMMLRLQSGQAGSSGGHRMPAGTVAVICVLETTVNAVAATRATPLNFTEVVPVKLSPLMVTMLPTAPLVGVKLLIVGGLITVKSSVLVSLASGVDTEIFPVVAPTGTTAEIELEETSGELA